MALEASSGPGCSCSFRAGLVRRHPCAKWANAGTYCSINFSSEDINRWHGRGYKNSFTSETPSSRRKRLQVRADSMDKKKTPSPFLADRYTRCVEKIEAAQELLDQGKVDNQGFYRLLFEAVSEEFPEASLVNYEWYDIDGKRITNLSKERISVLLQGRNLSPITKFSKVVDADLCKGLMRNVFAGGPFVVENSEGDTNGMRTFEGQLQTEPEEAYRILTDRMKLEYPELAIILGENEDSIFGEPLCTVGHRDLFAITPQLDRYVLFACIAGGLVSLSSVLKVDLDIITPGAALWNGILLPFGLAFVMLSSVAGQVVCSILYGITPSRHYFPIPVPNFGFTALSWNNTCMLPNRACLIDQVLASAVCSFVTSLFLMSVDTPAVPFYFRLLANDFGWHETAGELTNVTLIDSDLFKYSAILSEFSAQFSTAILTTAEGGSVIAIRPLALAGLMGLHLTAFSLIPSGSLNGGRIMRGVGGYGVYFLVSGLMWLIAVDLAFQQPNTIWLWAILFPFFGSFLLDERRRNDLASPGIGRSILGLATVGMGLFVLLPKEWFFFFFQKNPSTFVDQVGGLLSLFR